MIKKILVAFDGSPQSQRAFEEAMSLSQICRGAVSEIIVLSVVQPPEPIDIVEMDAVLDSATQHYEEMFKDLRERALQSGVTLRTDIVIGHPAEQIVRYARQIGCDIILIGSRGRSGITEFMMGSVSRRVASYAPCKVMILK